jgi:cytochrome c oxidase subunit 2
VTDTGDAGAGVGSGGPAGPETRHGLRLIVIWVVLVAIFDPLFWFLAGPHVPPGTFTNTAGDNQWDFNVLFMIALPVLLGVWLFMIYSFVIWRDSRGGPDPVGGPKAASNLGIQTGWIVTTTVIVLGLAAFGTYELVQPGGSGGGQGPSPIWTPTSNTVLPVQVIGQQWKFTYRYPTYGGFETNQLVLPADTTIAFHVTSLDVIHDFWAYQLSVKADANPAEDNVAFTTTTKPGSFIVRCAELCGLWHGAMYNNGTVISKAQFQTWATTTRVQLAANTRLLPPFAYSYVPDANSADGGYYPDSAVPYSNVETYGALPSPSQKQLTKP